MRDQSACNARNVRLNKQDTKYSAQKMYTRINVEWSNRTEGPQGWQLNLDIHHTTCNQ